MAECKVYAVLNKQKPKGKHFLHGIPELEVLGEDRIARRIGLPTRQHQGLVEEGNKQITSIKDWIYRDVYFSDGDRNLGDLLDVFLKSKDALGEEFEGRGYGLSGNKDVYPDGDTKTSFWKNLREQIDRRCIIKRTEVGRMSMSLIRDPLPPRDKRKDVEVRGIQFSVHSSALVIRNCESQISVRFLIEPSSLRREDITTMVCAGVQLLELDYEIGAETSPKVAERITRLQELIRQGGQSGENIPKLVRSAYPDLYERSD